MKNVDALLCRECGRRHDVMLEHVCNYCFGPLEVGYNLDAIPSAVLQQKVAEGPQSLWRYAPFLPDPGRPRVDLGAGFTRLREAPRLAAELGLKRLWLKNDGGNPTHSFKDRVVSVALSVAKHFGYSIAACASTGNLANSVAAHAAAAGMKSVVFIPHGLERGKLAATSVYGGDVIEVEGSYDDANRLCAELAATKEWAFVNVNLRPFYAEGSKTLAFEIAEQLGWRTPDALVAPVAAGSLLTKLGKGMRQLGDAGLIEKGAIPSLYGAQAEGCSPVARAFSTGADDVMPVKPNTVARSIAIGDPADGRYALRAVRDTGGAVVAVPEASIADGMLLLARTEGIFTETAGGVVVSALERLVGSGDIKPEEETVALITGVGLKTIEALPQSGPTHRIRPTISELERVLELETDLGLEPVALSG
jgi:threonine synthase